jgi:hypothetical protein
MVDFNITSSNVNPFLTPPSIMKYGESIVHNSIDIQLELLSKSKSNDSLSSTSTEEDKVLPKLTKFEKQLAKVLTKEDKDEFGGLDDKTYFKIKDEALIARNARQLEKQKQKEEKSARRQKEIEINKRNIELEAKYKEEGYTGDFKNCTKCGTRYPKTDEFYRVNPKSNSFYPICLDCSFNKTLLYEAYKIENVKEYECECGAIFSITPYDKDKKLFTLEKHYKTKHHQRYLMLNDETDDIDFNLFTIIELRKIIVSNKKEDGSYYVKGYANKTKKEIVEILNKYKDVIKLPA